MTDEERQAAQAVIDENLRKRQEEADAARAELEKLLDTPIDAGDAQRNTALGDVEIRQAELFIAAQREQIAELERRIADAQKRIAVIRVEQSVVARRLLNPQDAQDGESA